MGSWKAWYTLESDKFVNTDLLRFLASAGIVLYHYSPHAIDLAAAPYWLQGLIFNLTMMVDIFFVISGYIIYTMYHSRITGTRSHLDFIRKRLARLLPLHYLTLALYVAILLASVATGVAINFASYDVRCLPAQLTLTHAWGFCDAISFNGPSWSISAEFGVYLIAPLMFVLGRRTPIVATALLTALALGYLFVEGGPLLHQRTADFGVLRAFPAFLFGVWLASHRTSRWLAPLGRLPLWLTFLIFVLAPLAGAPEFVRFGLAYLLAAATFARDLRGERSAALLRIAPLGRLTYSLYMLHAPVVTIFVALLIDRVLHLDGIVRLLAIAGVAFVILPILSVMSLEMFEMPMRKWMSGTRGKRPQPSIATDIAP